MGKCTTHMHKSKMDCQNPDPRRVDLRVILPNLGETMKLGDFEHLKSTYPPIGILAIYFGLHVFLWENAECSSKVLSVTEIRALKALKPWENAYSKRKRIKCHSDLDF